jgi:hypothetical protein
MQDIADVRMDPFQKLGDVAQDLADAAEETGIESFLALLRVQRLKHLAEGIQPGIQIRHLVKPVLEFFFLLFVHFATSRDAV